MFKSTVEWCLIISTVDEVLLCALARNHGVSNNKPAANITTLVNPLDTGLQLVPTSFTIPTDNVRILSICGTKSGRIFLGGDDGCLYEFTYQSHAEDYQRISVSDEECLDRFYDEGKQIPQVLTVDRNSNIAQDFVKTLGKRAWNSLVQGSSSVQGALDGTRPRKCRKVNRTSPATSWFSAFLPDLAVRPFSYLFGGGAPTGGKIVQMVVDEDRQCLYTLSSGSEGWICSFDLKPSSQDETLVRFAGRMSTVRAARKYLEGVSRGQMFPPSTSAGAISFPGGGTSAQAGVGGMDGARAILKAADLGNRSQSNGRSTGGSNDSILKPISISVVTPAESQRVTLMAVTGIGLRYAISSLDPSVISSGPSMSRLSRPLAPSSRLTLCHIRSPPPTDASQLQDLTMDAKVTGGIIPRFSGTVDKANNVDACFYRDGVFVAAVENGTRQTAVVTGDGKMIGDVIVAACPDSVQRKMDVGEDSGKNKDYVALPGGVSETTSMPMVSAYGVAGESGDKVLPGGAVYSIVCGATEYSTVKTLTVHSLTPTDSELSVGSPPPYYPPSKVRARDIGSSSSTRDTRTPSATLANREIPFLSAARTVLRNLYLNSFASHYGVNGFLSQHPHQHDGGGISLDYRMSARDGSNGFSVTASETVSYSSSQSRSSSTKSSRFSRSARLRPGLLCPPAVPLNQLATQHLIQPAKFFALNPGGIHCFEVGTILTNLANALVSAGENLETDRTVTNFFKSYTAKEASVMCLMLSIGCGQAAAFGDDVRARARRAILTRVANPRLVPIADQSQRQDGAVGPLSGVIDPLVPPGYEFRSSDLSDALLLLVSRLLRPVWNKPMVVVTEGRVIKRKWSTATQTTPAKVEVLVNQEGLDEIRAPIRSIRALMQTWGGFSRAVKVVPGAPQHQDGGTMDIDDDAQENTFMRSLQYQGHLRAGMNGSSHQLSTAEAENIAHLLEEKNIHAIFRLVARAEQGLAVMSLLLKAQSMAESRHRDSMVDWGLLHGLTFSQLVQTPEGQERVESLLNSLLLSSAATRNPLVSTEMTNRLAISFGDECYLYFSPGSRNAFLGLRQAREALACPVGSFEREGLSKSAANHILNAARLWYSAPLITGRILHKKGQETFDQIALRAIQYGSPLAKSVAALMELGDVVNVVEVCLRTALNFKENRRSDDRFAALAPARGLPWERNLYHSRRDPTSTSPSTPTATASSPSSPSHIVTYGTSVTSRDAIETCYALIFYQLSTLLKSHPQAPERQLADIMASACAASDDRHFLESFFLFLFENGHEDMLLRIESPHVDKWLQGRNDPDLMFKYHQIHHKHREAGQDAWDQANNSQIKLSLQERVDRLSRAVTAFSAASEDGGSSGRDFETMESIAVKKKDAEERLRIAKIQGRILQVVQSESGLDLSAEMIDKLKWTLLPVSELFNDYAAHLGLYSNCLQILHACHHDDVGTIHRLWKNVICEELLPCATRDEVANSFLQHFVSDLGLGGEVKFLQASDPAGSLPLFERGAWAPRLEARIVSLGQDLYGTGFDYVFPIDFLLSTLQGTIDE